MWGMVVTACVVLPVPSSNFQVCSLLSLLSLLSLAFVKTVVIDALMHTCCHTHMLSYTHAVIYTCCHIHRAGQNRIYAPYMTVYSVISLPNIPYTHRIYMVLANPTFAHAVIYTCCHIHMLPYRQMSCT